MLIEILAVVSVVFLIYVYLTYYSYSDVYVVRYIKSDCPECKATQSEWDELVKKFNELPPEYKAKRLADTKMIEIDIDKSTSLDTIVWKSKYTPTKTPCVIAVYKNNVEEFTEPDQSRRRISKFVGNNIFIKYNLIKK